MFEFFFILLDIFEIYVIFPINGVEKFQKLSLGFRIKLEITPGLEADKYHLLPMRNAPAAPQGISSSSKASEVSSSSSSVPQPPEDIKQIPLPNLEDQEAKYDRGL